MNVDYWKWVILSPTGDYAIKYIELYICSWLAPLSYRLLPGSYDPFYVIWFLIPHDVWWNGQWSIGSRVRAACTWKDFQIIGHNPSVKRLYICLSVESNSNILICLKTIANSSQENHCIYIIIDEYNKIWFRWWLVVFSLLSHCFSLPMHDGHHYNLNDFCQIRNTPDALDLTVCREISGKVLANVLLIWFNEG